MGVTPDTCRSPGALRKMAYVIERAPAIDAAQKTYETLSEQLFAIQKFTGIPGNHTDINSDDDTPGVLERLKSMHDAGEGASTPSSPSTRSRAVARGSWAIPIGERVPGISPGT